MIHPMFEQILHNFTKNKKGLSPHSKIIFAELNTHLLYLLRFRGVGFEILFSCLFSASKYGINNLENSLGTPLGLHTICEKIGENIPIHGELVGRKFTGTTINQAVDKTSKAKITSRILRLKGCELGKNLAYDADGRCCDTYKRCVYIHGTNLEKFIPAPLSHGCLLLKTTDLITLFDLITVGDFCLISA